MGGQGAGSADRLDALAARIETRTARVGVIGLGYAGLPLALAFARRAFPVVGVDVDAERVAALARGDSPFGHVDSDEVARARAHGFVATTDTAALTRCDVIHVCVPTPLTRDRNPDLTALATAMETVAAHLRRGRLIVLGSTTYPGTTRELFVPLLERDGLRVGRDFALAFAPERIDPGRDQPLRAVPKVVGGETPRCTALAASLFAAVFDEVVPVSSTRSAEMVKLLENSFRAVNIGLANEVALMCHRLGVDVWEVIEAASTKPYGFLPFWPGPGLGGDCIPVDPTWLAWKMKALGIPARLIELATEVNAGMPAHVVQRIADWLNEDRLAVNGARILVVGVAYKADVADVRESPALAVMALLREKGAEVAYHDPHVAELVVGEESWKSQPLEPGFVAAHDLVVILTDHAAIDTGRLAARARRVFDTRGATRGGEAEGDARVRRL